MVLSPHNPHKKKESLANDYDRLHMLNLAIGDNPKLKSSDVEFNLPKPSYTIDTLAHLSEKYPDRSFTLIMGGDNLGTFHKWKNYEQILEHYSIIVFARPGYELGDLQTHPKVTVLSETPLLHISASYIRRLRQEGKSIQYLVPDLVYKAIEESSLYH
jgi:nicotinate-nucleotide adenylyltransferase